MNLGHLPQKIPETPAELANLAPVAPYMAAIL